jgi:hypothetical protein
MPIIAVNPETIANPEIPFDKVGWGVVINSTIAPDGSMRANGTLSVYRYRILPVDQMQRSPTPAKTVPFADWFKVAQEVPEVAAAWQAINAAVAAYNAQKALV